MKNKISINYLLSQKNQNKKLTKEEIYRFIELSVNNEIKDYQISTMLNAIFFNGMSFEEIYWLTLAMRDSGIKYKSNLNMLDKHSTGGVGDKVTLIISPILACFNISIFKISGRGLGYTGGTIDKLESIGINTKIDFDSAKDILKKNKISIIEQTSQLVPADKIFYALRNDTCTVVSIPLIASSIMSKKLALGSKYIYLDIKVGDGALFNNLKLAKEFGNLCIKIGKKENKKVICYYTNMNEPLGKMIGNKIEIIESIDFLKGKFHSKNLKTLIYKMTSDILIDFKISKSYLDSKKMIDEKIESLEFYNKFINWSISQGCKLNKNDFENLKLQPKYKETIYAKKDGNFKILSTLILGEVVFELGGGRLNKYEKIDYDAGIYIFVENSNKVKKNMPLIEIYSNSKITKNILDKLNKAFEITNKKVIKKKIILGDTR